jgi:hypothetical protein
MREKSVFRSRVESQTVTLEPDRTHRALRRPDHTEQSQLPAVSNVIATSTDSAFLNGNNYRISLLAALFLWVTFSDKVPGNRWGLRGITRPQHSIHLAACWRAGDERVVLRRRNWASFHSGITTFPRTCSCIYHYSHSSLYVINESRINTACCSC